LESRPKLVAHLKDGEIFKGHSHDFDATGETFHVFSSESPVACSRRIEIEELKALFFVRSWGRARHRVVRRYAFGVGGCRTEPGRRAVVRFRDGERIWGYVLHDAPAKTGFYLVPANPEDNNLKIFVVHSALEELRYFDDAGAAGGLSGAG
jgi:hypothetical protein